MSTTTTSLSETHGELVRRLFKNPEEILIEQTPDKVGLLHGAVGAAGEAGEILDQVKKYAIYNKTLDVANLVEELGDMEFYLEAIRQNIGVTREETLLANMNKLNKRYHKGSYSNDQAIARADKEEEANKELQIEEEKNTKA